MEERSLEILKDHLKEDYKVVLSQVPVLKKKIDILCLDNRELIAIEVKSRVTEIPAAVGQCSFYKQGAHKTFIALREDQAARISEEKRVLKELGIGLISFSEKGYRIVVDAVSSKPREDIMKDVLSRLKVMEEASKAAEGYRALSSPIRLQIYLTISREGKAWLKDVVSEWGESYPLVIKHIKILENAGLIESRKEGKETLLLLKSYPVEIKENIIKKRILELLSSRDHGLSIEDVSRSLKIARGTASKYLFVLQAEGKILARDVGKAKIHYPRRKDVEAWLRRVEK